MNIAVAEKLLDTLKKDQDKRTVRTLENIAKACAELIEQDVKITYRKVGQFCYENYGAPTEGTVNNDPKKLYKKLIDEYKRVAVKPSAKVESSGGSDDIPYDVRVYINHIESRLKMLESLVAENFEKERAEKVISLEDTLLQLPDQRGHVELVKSKQLTIEQREALEIITSSDELNITGEGNRRRASDSVSGKMVLAPSHFVALRLILEVD